MTAGFIFLPGSNGFQYPGQFRAKENADDGRRSFVSAQTVVVARAGHGTPQHVLIFIDAFDDGCQEQQELVVMIGVAAGIQQVFPFQGRQGPVVVLAAAVHPFKGLFMEQADHAMLQGDTFHEFHGQLVVVAGQVHRCINGRQFVLGRRYLVVFRLSRDAQLPQFLIQLRHKGFHFGFDGAEIMVLHLLPFGRLRPEQSAARIDQVFPFFPHGLVYQEVFLFRPNIGDDPFRMCAKDRQHPFGRFA